jgi:pimeloyl-ACP methyl ester carboxylesterase
MRKLFIVMILFSMMVSLTGCLSTGETRHFRTSSGYASDSLVFLPEGKQVNDVVFIVMHGKSSRPDADFRMEFYPELSDRGYEVIAPEMPWSKQWGGTPEEGVMLIDEIVDQVTQKGKRVVLVGHSLGGSNALIYAAGKPKKEVIGIVTIAPGHMLHRSNRMQRETESSVEKARAMVKAGDGDEYENFSELNTGKVRDVYMKANTYLSYYDLEKFPDIELLFPRIKLPVLWVAGDSDRLTAVYNMEFMFEGLPDNPKSRYIEVSGNHKSVLPNSAADIVEWVEKL